MSKVFIGCVKLLTTPKYTHCVYPKTPSYKNENMRNRSSSFKQDWGFVHH